MLGEEVAVYKRYAMAPLDRGTVGATQPLIEQLIATGSDHPVVRQTAAGILDAVAARDATGEVTALFSWVVHSLRYTQDPVDTEYVQSAPKLIERIYQGQGIGDCDDYVVLLGALLESVGYPVHVVLSQADPYRSDYSHVYLEVELDGELVTLDPILPRPAPGKKLPWEGRRRSRPVPQTRDGLMASAIGSWFEANALPLAIGLAVGWWLARR